MHSYKNWKEYQKLSEELLIELDNLNDEAIKDAFYQNLAFGTGGLRGIIGVGTNRMNIYTVAKASRGFAKYILSSTTNKTCAVAYDSRIKSDLFAKITAATLAQAGIKTYIYSELMPTPMLSYAVRKLGCFGGVCITASHNPAKYNGYKVYGEDGCQITLNAADEISSFINNEPDFIDEMPNFEELVEQGVISYIDDDVISSYFDKVQSLAINKIKTPLNIVYSPLNGAGNKPVFTILKRIGNVNVSFVKQQKEPDGNFSTCPYPNPEVKEAMELAIKQARLEKADFCMATDPDCDRIGVAVVDGEEAVMINGNEMGIMLLEYICTQRLAKNIMPQNPLAVKTIVTSELAKAVCKKYNVELINVLTGFKFIGEQIGILEQKGEDERFIFGFEESYGYLSGSFVRDKDAVIAAMLICEMAAYYKSAGKTLLDVLANTYDNYGYYKNNLLTFEFAGADGMAKMNKIIDAMRKYNKLGRYDIISKTDYLNDNTGLPKSNVLSLELSHQCYVILRPSGTEPKLKLYLTAVGETDKAATISLEDLAKCCDEVIATFYGI